MNTIDYIEERFPYECRTRFHYDQVVPWCRENIGEFDQEWYRYGSDIALGATGMETRDTYRFQTEQMAVLFKLRWS